MPEENDKPKRLERDAFERVLQSCGGITRLVVGRKAGGGFGFHSIADSATPALPGFERPQAFTF